MIRSIIIFLSFLSYLNAQNTSSNYKEVLKLMGTRFELTATADSDKTAKKAVAKGIEEISRIERLISSWKSDSETNEINRNAGIKPVSVSKELFSLIERSIKISNLTNGSFDISFASMERIYVFDKKEHSLPAEADRIKAIKTIGYKNIILDRNTGTVFLAKTGMRIGFGGIGKGYAANRAKAVMSAIPGVLGGVVNAAGDLVVWGENGRTNGWPIQIADPKNNNKSLGWLTINSASVVTSGDYEKYFMNNGKRYSHIINPDTGLPSSGIKSATIVSPDAEIGDALATAIFVLGAEEGMLLINKLKNIEALIITDSDTLITSNNLKLNNY